MSKVRTRDAVETVDEDGDVEIDGAEESCKRQRTTTLRVTVQTPGNAPVAHPEVRAVNTVDNSVTTLTSGIAQVIRAGTYDLRAYAPWHWPAPQTTNTVAVVEQQLTEVTMTLTPLSFHLHVDADRDGAIDDDRTNLDAWAMGAASRGAIILCNNDDDDLLGEAGHGAADHADEVVNHHNDPQEIAPLELRRHGPLGATRWRARLEILGGNHARARIFASRNVGAASIAGPAAARSGWIDLDQPVDVMGVEAIEYRHANFNGLVDVQLTVEAATMNADLTAPAAGTVTYQEVVRFGVAPWMMPNHFDPVQRAYVADLGADNAALRAELANRTANVTVLMQATHNGDRWLQDCMEIGYSNLPGHGINAVLQAPRGRRLRPYPATLRGTDVGFHDASRQQDGTTFDSFGNLEVSPPLPNRPFGRIYYCRGTNATPFDDDVREFLNAQIVQEPFELDANWLTVGHVDEMVSMVPDTVNGGFKVLIASAQRAYDILNLIPIGQRGAVRMFTGRDFARDAAFYNPHSGATEWRKAWYRAEVSVAEFLQDGLFHREVTAFRGLTAVIAQDPGLLHAYNMREDMDLRVHDFDVGLALRDYNLNTVQPHLDAARITLQNALGLQPADFIHVPVLFVSSKMGKIMAGALSADMVNMIVFGTDCVVPLPYGPVQAGADLFEADVRQALQAIGVTAHFVDDWEAYHLQHGEVHCGTNVLRKPAAWPQWWTFQ